LPSFDTLLIQALNGLATASSRAGRNPPVLSAPSLQGANPDPAAPFTAVLTNTLNVEIGTRGVRWDHLIYAYMIANTRIRPIFRRVVHELLHGERFGAPREEKCKFGR